MKLKTAIAGLATIVILAGGAVMPSAASAQRGGRGAGVGNHAPGGAFHPGGGGGFRGSRGGYGGFGRWIAVYPWWGYGGYPWPYYYGPSCGYVHVKYYHRHRAYWHWIYRCE